MVGAADAHGGTGRTTPRGTGSPQGDRKKVPRGLLPIKPAVRLTNDTRPLAQSGGPAAVAHPGAAAQAQNPPTTALCLGYVRTLYSVRDGTVPACMQEYARDCISQRDCNLALPRTRTSSLLSARVRVF